MYQKKKENIVNCKNTKNKFYLQVTQLNSYDYTSAAVHLQ